MLQGMINRSWPKGRRMDLKLVALSQHSWNFTEQFPRSILAADTRNIFVRMSERCYKETAYVEFKLICAVASCSVFQRLTVKCPSSESWR